MSGKARIAIGAALAALTLGLAACGGDEEETTTAATTGDTTTSTATGATGGQGLAACEPSEEEAAGIDPATGETGGLEPDCREGTQPPPVELADLEQAANAAGCELELDLRDEGNTHVPRSTPTDFATSPPTSGDHDSTPLADGAYAETPDERYFVHSMEHGRVVVEYQPDLAEEDQLALKGLFDEDPQGLVLIPYPRMDYDVAASAWTNLIGCDTYSPEALDAIRAFIDEFRGNGPEAIPL